ncbi:N-acetylgalactosaminyltransferase 7-like [Clavelina lepadiformis]|uniref:Polypeptide N-acetylgalactosaminyltransferase n=1 Tax=Clavelina lepadiformis TaxID=159417 RepID=A0ABP0F520_CLALP
MRWRAKNLIKIVLLLSCVSFAYYFFMFHQDEATKHTSRNRPDQFDYHENVRAQKEEYHNDAGHKNFPNDQLLPVGKDALPFSWEKRGPGDFDYPKYVPDRLGNYESQTPDQKRAGAGEYGEEVLLDASLETAVKGVIAEFGFNTIASDRVSLDRAPKDLRHTQCKHWDYPPRLTTVSVVIVFHNEAWSPLMRTVHNVINYTPKEYLHEIVMIDDGSHKDHLGSKLDEYIIKFNGLVKLYRNSRREGLIRARSIGAKKSTGEILIYLDAHCEAEPNWLPPLITPILNDRRACTVPLIDVIDGNKYTFTEQAGGDSDGLARGAWDWSFQWKRIPLTKVEKANRKQLTQPYRSPAMAGGLFAIDRDFFFEIGLYDDGLEIWGGENFELSYKVWMCGGQLLFVPCSRVGHVYRLPGWNGNPPPAYVAKDAVLRNYKRVIETWWDEYSQYFYMRRPEVKRIDTGDLTKQKAIRQTLQCRSFDWFMKEIAYDIPKHFPLVEPPSGASGQLKNIGTNKCLDGKNGGSGSPIYVSDCDKAGGELNWWLTWHEDIRPGIGSPDHARKVCLDCVGRDNVASFWECHHMQGNQLWKYIYDLRQLYHSVSSSCLEASPGESKVYARECNHNNVNQLWTWTNVNITQLATFNTNLHKAAFVVDV